METEAKCNCASEDQQQFNRQADRPTDQSTTKYNGRRLPRGYQAATGEDVEGSICNAVQ